MANEKRKDRAKKIAFGACCLTLIGAGIFIFTFINNSRHDYLTISGLDGKASVDITLEQKGGTRTLTPKYEDRAFYLPSIDNLPEGDYILTATMQDGGKYKDVRFLVNRGKGHVSIIASGFTPKESLSFGQKSGLHFDWNGRIELEQSFSSRNNGAICLETNEGLNICHIVKGGAA